MYRRLKEFYLNRNIRGKINISVVGTAGLILIILMVIVSLRSRSIVMENAIKATESHGMENAARAAEFINKKLAGLETMDDCFESQEGLGLQKFDIYQKMMARLLKDDADIYAIWYVEDTKTTDTTGTHRYLLGADGSNSDQLLKDVEASSEFSTARQKGETAIGEPMNFNGTWLVNIIIPTRSEAGSVVGAVGYLVKIDFLNKLVSGETNSEGYCKMISGMGTVLAHLDKEKVGLKTDEGDQTDEIVEKIKKGEIVESYAHSSHLGGQAYKVFVPIKFDGTAYTWSFCTAISTSAMMHATNMLVLITIFLIIAGLVVLVLTTNYISKSLSDPIVRTSKELTLIAEGRLDLTKEMEVNSKDEVGQMVGALNLLTSSLKHLAHFAHEVGKGNMEAAMEEKNEQDVIGKAMVEMKRNLITARDAEELRIYEDKIQDWKFEGAARIHETIRKENTSVKHLCDSILREVISYTGSIQGGIFVINDDQMDERYVELVSCIAYNRAKMMDKKLSIDEGLIGRCIFERAPIVLAEIPQDYLAISSGLGDRKPNYLVIMPLLNNEQIVGVVEIAAFNAMEPHVVEYLEKAAENLASAISNVNINERTQRLLDQSKEYSEEMAAQEEELRQNMEEMQAAQEEMHRKTWEYEQTIESLRAQLAEKE